MGISDGHLAGMLEETTDFVGVADPKGRILYINKAGRSMLEIGAEEDVTKLLISDITPARVWDIFLKEGLPAMSRDGIWSGEFVLLGRSGQEIPVSVVSIAHKLPNGEVEYQSVIARDITERKRIEGELRDNSSRLQLLVQASPLAIIVHNRDGLVTNWNPAAERIFGWKEDEVLGRPLPVVPEEGLNKFLTVMENLQKGEVINNLEEKGLTKSGSRIDISISAAPIRDPEGNINGFLGVIADVSDRKRSEEIIQQQARDILDISTPVVQLWEGVLALPLIGTLDSQRTQQITERLLNRIVETNSPFAIIDLTGVPTVDTQTGRHLIDTIAAVRLLGTQTLLTGIRPEIAQTLVHLGIDMTGIVTRTTLASGLRYALEGINPQITRTMDKK